MYGEKYLVYVHQHDFICKLTLEWGFYFLFEMHIGLLAENLICGVINNGNRTEWSPNFGL